MMNAHSAIRSAVRSYIQQDKAISNLTLRSNEALDFSDTRTIPWKRASFDGFRHKFSLSSRFPKDAEETADALCHAVIKRLHHADIDLDGHALIDLSFAQSQLSTCDDYIKCSVEFDAVTISD